MRYRDSQQGSPQILYKNTKSILNSLIPSETGAIAFATDTRELGIYTSTGWQWFSPSAGSGDMLKSVYDPDNDNMVDYAEYAYSVDWDYINGKPSTYPPESHNHNSLYYTKTELNTSGAGGQVHWDNVTNKPPLSGSGYEPVSSPILFTDCLYANAGALNPFYGAAISSGTINAPTTTYIDSSVIGAVRLRSSTTANGGYLISSSAGGIIPIAGTSIRGRFNFQNFATTTFRFGIHNSTTSSAPTNGIYFQFSASGVIDGRRTVSSSTTTTPSTYTLSTNTWYTLNIEIGSSSTTFNIYDTSGNILWSSSISGSPLSTQLAFALVVTESSTTATDMCHVDYLLLKYTNTISRG